MLQIRQNDADLPNSVELKGLRDSFHENGFVCLHSILEKNYCAEIVEAAATADYKGRLTPGIGNVEVCQREEIRQTLNNQFSHPAILNVFSGIYTDRRVDLFNGTIVRRIPGKNHFSRYHNDAGGSLRLPDDRVAYRSVALSLNLSPANFGGGELEIAKLPLTAAFQDPEEVQKHIQPDAVEVVSNEGVGDALLFAIAPNRFHRVRDVTEGGPRVVFVGWFYTVVKQDSP